VINHPAHPQSQNYASRAKREIGRDTLLQFDPDYDPLANCPFNSGVFASRRLTISESNLASLNRSERDSY
jgi:hypothetical protein